MVESLGYRLSTEQFERFRELVYGRAGIALRPEKQQLLCSRLAKRMRALGLSSFDAYYDLVTAEAHPNELEQLLNAVTTNKTSFFREAHHFTMLRERVVAPLQTRPERIKLRVWSAACSTGEEPYSILLTLLSSIAGWEQADIRVLASDIDTDVLAAGERGVYPESHLADLPDPALQSWFVRGTGEKAGMVRACRALRERVAFRRINFVDGSWPIHTQFDAIFCRNALIYFDSETQRRVVGGLLSFLKVGGFLFLGHSESMAGVRPELKSLGRTSYQLIAEPP